ncbi:hypothetical protein BJY01DRAFT_225003 [Aspergillus pseudoustus]|uniref:Aminoglycoside phosphotransferase domain-containing protein n=1 Tax=Aspergillus pseudoustus TaxID=1810923 RepID=A0ABR4J136_9EURO
MAQPSDASTHLKDVEHEALAQVNALLLKDISSKLKAYPSMDLTDILQQKLKTYPALRQVFRDSALQSLEATSDSVKAPSPPADPRDEYRIPLNVEIIRPLGPAVLQTVQLDLTADPDDLSAVLPQLNGLVSSSEKIWQLGSTAVLGLDSQLVMKAGRGIDIDHIAIIDYLRQHAPQQLPIPAIHGILHHADSERFFVFMSRAPGVPLDSKWKSLTAEQKVPIRDQLDTIVATFRSIPVQPSEENPRTVLGGGNPRRCKDARRDIRVSDEPISNEAEFNAFISSNPRRSDTAYISMVRSYLTTDHKIVMTHGDLHPRNIMVSITPGEPGKVDHVTITALLDWEMCGWYPEYWEYVKALNTITLRDGFDDWYAYLPPSIGVWPREHAVDIMLSRWHG